MSISVEITLSADDAAILREQNRAWAKALRVDDFKQDFVRARIAEDIAFHNRVVAAVNNSTLHKHRDRWWDTYNAALTGLCTQQQEHTTDELHSLAFRAANAAHGVRNIAELNEDIRKLRGETP